MKMLRVERLKQCLYVDFHNCVFFSFLMNRKSGETLSSDQGPLLKPDVFNVYS